MRENPRPQEIYRHFKGNLYQIVTIAEHTESREQLVIYQAMYGSYKIYARPLTMFMGPVDQVKYPEITQQYRFEKVDPAETTKKMETVSENVDEEPFENEEELQINPAVLEFLDADTNEERLNLLASMHGKITEDMISTMAVSLDFEIEKGTLEERYIQLKNCLLTKDKYERTRHS